MELRILEYTFQKEVWTEDADNRIRDLFAGGLTDREIATEMAVTEASLAHRRQRLELFRWRAPRNANRWTPERVAILKKLFAEGASASGIAAGIGDGFTRNSIIGKLHRLGLSRPRVANPKRRPPPKPKGFRPRKSPSRPQLELVIDNTADEDIPLAQRKSFMELTADTCRYGIGDPRSPEFFFCGAETAGTSYCPQHYRTCYQCSFKSVGKVVNRVVEKLERQRRDNAQIG